MARPLPSGKQTVDLSTGGVRVSRIRRDPPPKVKEEDPIDAREREARMVVIGTVSVTLVICLILVVVGSALGWTPRDYVIFL